MKSGLYYHPNRINDKDSPTIMNSGQYDTILHFVQLIEKLVPECLDGIKSLRSDCETAQKWLTKMKYNAATHSPSYWNIVKDSPDFRRILWI